MSYYHYQRGGGGILTVYRGSPNQRGHGIGTFLKGLFRASLPILQRGARVVGKELFHSGVNFLNDLDNNVPAGSAFQSRLSEAQSNLKRKAANTLLGGGRVYKKKRSRQSGQSKTSSRKRKSSRKVKHSRRRPTRKTKKRKPKKRATKKRPPKKRRQARAGPRSKYSSDIFG